MGDFVKWLDRTMWAFILLLLVAIFISNNSESGHNAIIIADIFQWILIFGTVGIAGLKAYVKYKNNPEEANSELRVMAMTICGVVGVAVCVALSFTSDTLNIWQQWFFWTCVITAIVGGVLWIGIGRRKRG